MLLQSIFLLLPIDVAKEKPVARRRWVVVAIVAALMMGLLMGGLVCAVGEVVMLRSFPIREWEWLLPFWLAGGSWVVWALIFLWQTFSQDPGRAFERTVKCLLAGSVAELLVAVPCHIYARGKEYCCAGFGTALGLATGLAVLLFAFGPGVFFLFVARARRLRGNRQQGAADTKEDQRKRGSYHTRDATVWLAVSLGFLVLAGASGFLPEPEDAAVLRAVCIIAFLVLAGKAAFAFWRAAKHDEPPWFSFVVRARWLRENADEETPAEEEGETKLRSPHTREAAVWLAGSVGFLVLDRASGITGAQVLRLVCILPFLVLAGKAALTTRCAAQDDEPRWFNMVIALLAVLALVLLALLIFGF